MRAEASNEQSNSIVYSSHKKLSILSTNNNIPFFYTVNLPRNLYEIFLFLFFVVLLFRISFFSLLHVSASSITKSKFVLSKQTILTSERQKIKAKLTFGKLPINIHSTQKNKRNNKKQSAL